ncbi:MAG: HipA domain-containing protein [Candidatus Cloacimonetes bacterium]|jgi:serine/threonine-protein kinase HipA|nr:HipA domain-containing protein [Candidatus Cloacimonadota bacterium]MBT4333247.1 HipA domain-containing protein [Candidatus Cloacimonadota bacterium]MBT5421265.1 HipA domain-containing protein [Candidatus Cloacimonadota bacterium]
MNRCLYCYAEISQKNDILYHKKCSKKFFGFETAPTLSYAKSELGELAKNIVKRSVTVPGVQTKLSLQIEKKRNEGNRFTLVGLWGNYILKPPVEEYPELPQNEDLIMHLAELFGIKTVPHALIPLKSGELAYITRRIDRIRKNEKIQMEDLCQLSERLTEDKYKGSMEQVTKVVKKYSDNPMLDALTLFEITLFSFIVGNADMHLKNFSLIYEHNLNMLAPAYDLLSTRLVIPERKDPEETALTINGKKSNLKRKDFEIYSKNINLSEKQFNNVFDKFTRTIPIALDFIGNSFLSENKKEELKKLINVRTIQLDL